MAPSSGQSAARDDPRDWSCWHLGIDESGGRQHGCFKDGTARGKGDCSDPESQSSESSLRLSGFFS